MKNPTSVWRIQNGSAKKDVRICAKVPRLITQKAKPIIVRCHCFENQRVSNLARVDKDQQKLDHLLDNMRKEDMDDCIRKFETAYFVAKK